MSVHVFSPLVEGSCEEEIRRAFPFATIESEQNALILTEGRFQLRLALESWGGPANNQNRFEDIRSEVRIESKILGAEKVSWSTLDDTDRRRLGEMVRLAIETLDPKEYWQDNRSDSSFVEKDQ